MAGGLGFLDFSADVVRGLLSEPTAPTRPEVDYLFRYLTQLKVTSVLVERHYVDRHYLDEFAAYYSRSFRSPPSACVRLHFFEGLSATELQSLFAGAYVDDATRERVENSLRERYLGFVVRRPLPDATIGRTVLKTYPVDGRRHYTVVRPYTVNVAGLALHIRGLAYQQQDGGAAVCASTALWSALQRVAYASGQRTPTPHAITEAAGSAFPARVGLDLVQMATALRALGYTSDAFPPITDRAAFRAKIVTALASHLPVILLVVKKAPTGAGEEAGLVQLGHAVCVTGYSEPPRVAEIAPRHLLSPRVEPLKTRDGSLEVIYVHDDNLGSHAHYELVDSDERDEAGHRVLLLRRGRTPEPVPATGEEGTAGSPPPPDDWRVAVALVPKPAKLRASIEDVFYDVFYVRSIAAHVFPGLDLEFSARVVTGVEYRRSLFSMSLHAPHAAQFQAILSLPRHVGVVSVQNCDLHLCDVVLDVSEVRRNPFRSPLLAIVGAAVPFQSRAWQTLAQLTSQGGIPFVWAPPTSFDAAPPAAASRASS